MKRVLSILLAGLVVVTAMLAFTTVPALADDDDDDDDDDEELAASGAFIPTGLIELTDTPLEEVVGGCIAEFTGPFVLTDTLLGAGSFIITAFVESPCDEVTPFSIPASFEGHGTWTGTVAATASGSFDFEVKGTVDVLIPLVEFEIEIEEGSGGLDDLEGELRVVGPSPFELVYSGELEFDD